MITESDILAELKKRKQKSNGITVNPSKSGMEAELLKELDKRNIHVGVPGEENNTVSLGDIAPIGTTVNAGRENNGGLDFFQKGAFEDGFDWYDIPAAILGTTADAGVNVAKGVVRTAEGIADLVGYGGAAALNWLGETIGDKGLQDDAAYWKKNVTASTTDKMFGGTDNFLDQYSVLGSTSDAILEGVGQVGVTLATGGAGQAAGLGKLGVSALTSGTMLLSGTGSGMSDAYSMGANDLQALKIGLNSGAADAVSELIFGGLGKGINALGFSKGLSGADDMLAKLAGSKIKNQVAKNIVEFGIKAGAEGLEEVISGVAQAYGKHKNLLKEQGITFEDVLKDENLLEQFVVGAVTSGVMQGGGIPGTQKGSLIEANRTGRDFITGLSTNEQAVVDKVYNDRVAEAEESGKVSQREKTKIYDEVLEDMEKGYISTDIIEEVLGGDNYKAYKAYLDNETALKDEVKALEAEYKTLTDKESKTLAEKARITEIENKYQEIKAKIDNPNTAAQKGLLKSQLNKGVYEMTKNDKLRESYFELVRSKQKYEADLSQYEGKAKEVIQKVMESGLADNSNQSHEFWDMMANLSAKSNKDITLASNEQLLELVKEEHKAKGLEFDESKFKGQIIDGYVSDKGIVLNAKTKRALNFVVGHEITHTLEKTNNYKNLQQILFEYAKDEYESRYNERAGQYRNKFTEEQFKDSVDKEVTADLVGDILFTDKNFVRHLTKDRNVFQKVWDEVKHLAKMATAGSSQARQLEKVKREFEKAWREAGKEQNNTAESGAKYSLTDKTTPSYEELVAKNPAPIVNVKAGIVSGSYADMKTAAMSKATSEGWFDKPHHNNDTDSLIFLTEKSFGHAYSNLTAKFGEDTIRSMAHIPEIIENAVLVSVDDPRDPTKQETKVYTFFGAIDGVGGIEPVKLTVKEYDFSTLDAVPQNIRSYFEENGVMDSYDSLYDAHALEVIGIEGIKKEPDASGKVYELGSEAQATSDSEISIADLLNLVKGDAAKYIPKRQYSLSDSDGRQLSKEQSEYFKDSKVRDENGNLMVMYHGTPNGEFTVFKDGTYFTANKEYADLYQDPNASMLNSRKTASNPKTFEVYLDIKKPFDLSDPEARRVYIEDYIKGGNAIGINPYMSAAEYAKIKSIDWTEGEDLREFLIDNGYDYDGLVLDEGAVGGYGDEVKSRGTSYVVFSPEQVKNVDNTKPTADPDIRYSLSEYTAEEKKAHNKAVLDHFGKTYSWAETGYVLLDGSKLDLSGKHEGAPGGYRTVDHRDIVDALGSDYGDDTYSGSLVQFMSEGNIRISPESNGINLSVKPTKAQEQALSDFISRARGEVLLDIDDFKGYTVASVEYPRGTHANKVLNDIREWFDNGKEPQVSSLSQYRYSLSEKGQQHKQRGRWNVYGKDILLDKGEVAPVSEETATNIRPNITNAGVTQDETQDLFPDDLAPMGSELDNLLQEKEALESKMLEAVGVEDFDTYYQINTEYEKVMERIKVAESELAEADADRIDSLVKSEAPPETVRHYDSLPDTTVISENDIADIAREAKETLALKNTQMGDLRKLIEEYSRSENPSREQLFNDIKEKFGTYKERRFEQTISDAKKYLRTTKLYLSDTIMGDIADFADFKKRNRGKVILSANGGLEVDAAYAEMNGQWPHLFPENIINPTDQLLQMVDVANKNSTVWADMPIDDNAIWEVANDIADNVADMQQLQRKANADEIAKESFDSLIRDADQYAPIGENVAPVAENIAPVPEAETTKGGEVKGRKATHKEAAQSEGDKVAKILFDRQQTPKQKSAWKWAREHIFSKGAIFEDLSLKTGNRELQARFDNIRRAESRAQTFMGKGKGYAKALVDVRKTVEDSGKTEDFNYYLYHLHNVDRMTLEQRFKDVPNKSVFGGGVDAETSRKAAMNLETVNPEFKGWAEDVYAINKHLRQMMVDEGIISQETADLWQTMYPHYVPISRAGQNGLNVNVPLDTKRTGVNAPIKKATGGNSDFYNVFDTMGSRIEQTYKAIAKNRFGVELMNTLGTEFDSEQTDIDTVLDTMDAHEELLQEGKNGESPTFTVFRDGERVKFAITDDMYDAMKPSQFTYTSEVLRKINDIRRDILTTYSPTFALSNPIKDVQDILMNSQHPVKTYAAIPEAIYSVIHKDQWYQERMENGGEQDSYFDGQTKTFKKEKSKLSKIVGFPFEKIRAVNEVIEQVPRMAEYIASRKMGRSIDVSMLDAARVTTNFGAAGDLTNMLNRNGFTFLGASVEGFNQQVRNVREAKAEGAKGWAKLAGKCVAAGLPALLLNHLLWDDDEDYEELSDYVKQNYYVVAKTKDGKFVRIPKGRAVSVIQDAFKQMENLITGNDEADFGSFAQLVINNLAPNNPLENNLIAPIYQAATNKTWYGDDLVPTRLQKVPGAEQFDETTDSFSKWLGEVTGISPYKVNYVLDQYSGGVGDMILPYLTPEADGGGIGAALRDKFVTDPVLKNQNVSDFYDLKDELTVNANSSAATDEDKLKYLYTNAINSELSKLYQQKREIQNSNLSDAEKYAAVHDLQQQIVDLAKEGLTNYQNISYEDDYRAGGEYARVGDKVYKLSTDGSWQKLSDDQLTKYEVTKAAGDEAYATDGQNHYKWYVPGEDASEDAKPEWRKITKDELERQKEVTSGLGISPEEYWGKKDEYSYAYDYPGKYAVSKAVSDDFGEYRNLTSAINDIKNKNDSSSGVKDKDLVTDYINGLDLDYGQKIILYRSMYDSKQDKADYNMDIVNYLNSREDISYEEMETILKELDFEVSSDGYITW